MNWIDKNRELPLEGMKVLVVYQHTKNIKDKHIKIMRYFKNGVFHFYYGSYEITTSNITHWSLLPDLPREKHIGSEMLYCKEHDIYVHTIDCMLGAYEDRGIEQIPDCIYETHSEQISISGKSIVESLKEHVYEGNNIDHNFAYWIVENACHELHEDAICSIDTDSIRELADFLKNWYESEIKNGLEEFLKFWCDKQTGTESFFPDYNKPISLIEYRKDKD